MDLPRAIWEGTFTLMGVTLRCSVLDNGWRVINAEDVQAWMREMESPYPTRSDPGEVSRFAQWRAAK